MKKIGLLLLGIIGSIFFITKANAEVKSETLKSACTEESLTCNYTENKDTSSLPNIYVFRGTSCGYCAKLLTYLASIMDTYKDKVNVVVYEVANNTDNMSLYRSVAAKFGDTVQGYPYMVIGKTKIDGYSSEDNTTIVEAIQNYISSDEVYDVITEVNAGNNDLISDSMTNEKNNLGAVIAFIFGVVVVIGLFTGYNLFKQKE